MYTLWWKRKLINVWNQDPYIPSCSRCFIDEDCQKIGNPYKVNELSHEDFLDLWTNIGYNTTVNVSLLQTFLYLSRSTVAMNDIKIIRVEKDSPFKIKYKKTYDCTVEFEEIFIQQTDVEENEEVIREKVKSQQEENQKFKGKRYDFPWPLLRFSFKEILQGTIGTFTK